MERKLISPLFQVHMLNDLGKDRAARIAEIFDNALLQLGVLTNPGREYAIMCTKLEEAAFFAKKSMANNDSNQQ